MRSSKKQDKATTKTRQYTTIQYKNNYSFHSHSSKPQNTKPHPPKKQTNTLLHFTTNPYTHKPNNLFRNRLLHQHSSASISICNPISNPNLPITNPNSNSILHATLVPHFLINLPIGSHYTLKYVVSY